MAKVLDAWASQRLLSSIFPFPPTLVTRDPEDALSFARQHYPVVLKAVSDEIVHKTDAGAVVLNVSNDDTFLQTFYRLLDRFNADIMVQPMVSGVELFVGAKQDPQFGPVILFGLGGIFVEVFNDVSARVTPITESDAREMIDELRGRKIMYGARGYRVDLDLVVDLLVRFSRFVAEHPELKEVDLNPVFAGPDYVYAVDARIVL